MLKLTLLTVRIFINNGWDDSIGWLDYLFREARLWHVTPDELAHIAVSYPNYDSAVHAVWRAQNGMHI